MTRSITLLAALAIFLNAKAADAEIFQLATGGQIEGQLVNRDQKPRKAYIVKLPGGGQITLSTKQVKKILAKSDAELWYEGLLAKMPETADGHWKMARWCKENLKKHHEFHLEQVIKHDLEHEGALRALGFSNIDGRWIRPDDLMKQRGYVRFGGAWRLPQEIEVEKKNLERDQARIEWARKLKRWRGWIGKKRHREAVANINAIRDHRAAPALADLLGDKKTPPAMKLLYINALGKIDSAIGENALIERSLFDFNENIRDRSIDWLAEKKSNRAVSKYIAALGHKENLMINRAGAALGRMNDSRAIMPLINVLVTTHRYKVGGSSGQIGAGFGKGPDGNSSGGLNTGGPPKTIERNFRNQAVLNALIQLIPNRNYQYDEGQWKRWYLSTHTPLNIDLRRGN